MRTFKSHFFTYSFLRTFILLFLTTQYLYRNICLLRSNGREGGQRIKEVVALTFIHHRICWYFNGRRRGNHFLSCVSQSTSVAWTWSQFLVESHIFLKKHFPDKNWFLLSLFLSSNNTRGFIKLFEIPFTYWNIIIAIDKQSFISKNIDSLG